ncbi:MAG: LLM class flavin-dependent oxidoreductase [SAR202 cluster bacterium]|nr:LLM class flavin-dependent oxidoreductase [SAR202 cluster bacterium]
MKFAFFMMPLHLPTENPSLAFDRDLDLINFAEDLGYDEFFVGEHHSAAWETIPAPEMFLARASATAKRIRLGTAVINLPFHHPFHIAERMAFLDHLTRGRVTLGVGPSALPPDIKLFNLPFADLRPMMNESIEIIVKLLESPEPVTYEGKFWKLKDMALQLRSYQQPRLPLAIATGGSKNALELAARYEMNLFSGGSRMTPPGSLSLDKQWAFVEQAAAKHGKSTDRNRWRISTYVHLAETREQAWDDIQKGAHRDVHDYFMTINGKNQFEAFPGQEKGEITVGSVADMRGWIVGTPDDAIERIEALNKLTGGIGGIMQTMHEWLPTARYKNSLELFARYVIPHFRGHTVDLKREWERTKEASQSGSLPGVGSKPPQVAPGLGEHKSNVFVAR